MIVEVESELTTAGKLLLELRPSKVRYGEATRINELLCFDRACICDQRIIIRMYID